MNFGKTLIQLLGIQGLVADNATAAKPYTEVPQSEIKSILSLVNRARRSVYPTATKMNLVTWNYGLQAELKKFIANTDPAWFFGKNQSVARYNSQIMMTLEPFKTKFPDHDFFIHDGCQSAPNGITRIFQYRAINQRDCFNYSNCADTPIQRPGYINKYMSCNKDPYPEKLASNTHCSWFWQYYPKIVKDNVEDIACALFGHKGPNAAGGYRPNHFFCFYGKEEVQTSERPYVAGAPGSECKTLGKKVVNKLCV